jgi:5-(carboxyamino)imidazole ribonucleotide synthase
MNNTRTILPGATIGILGGGQLGRMMALSARAMGYRIVTLDPTPDSPCGQVADEQIVASFIDVDAALQMAERCDVVTYEFENVEASVASALEIKAYVPQGSKLLATTQHRILEKRMLEEAGIPVAANLPVHHPDELRRGVQQLGLPCVLKTTRGGYDGKGQWMLRTMDDVENALKEIAPRFEISPPEQTLTPFILETFVPFEREISVIVARNPRGEIRSFPVAENIHVRHILHQSIVPARIAPQIQDAAIRTAERVAAALHLVGLLAVEMFLTADGEIYVNELAPRPHNSGHYTMDACVTSQFEQHIRAICNLPLGSTELMRPVVMVNVLGEHVEPLLAQMPQLPDNVKVHLYGKHEAKSGRKMGHINVLAERVEDALNQIRQFGIWD